MLKQALLCTVFIASLAGTAGAEQPDKFPSLAANTSGTRMSDYTHVFSESDLRTDADSMPALLAAVSAWLSENFDLPATNDRPGIELTSPARILALRYRQALPQTLSGPGAEQAMMGAGRSVVAVYDDAKQVIYLPEGWIGASPAEQSVLVHEMVHHLQNRAGLKYACPQQREKLAYEAQEGWLARFGSSLEEEFEVDRFTLLLHVSCML